MRRDSILFYLEVRANLEHKSCNKQELKRWIWDVRSANGPGDP